MLTNNLIEIIKFKTGSVVMVILGSITSLLEASLVFLDKFGIISHRYDFLTSSLFNFLPAFQDNILFLLDFYENVLVASWMVFCGFCFGIFCL